MNYTKPILQGFAALAAIQCLCNKQFSFGEAGTNPHTQPAYEADE